MTASPAPPDPVDDQVRPFADILREMGRGTTHTELSEGLQQLVSTIRELHKGGSLTYKITIKPLEKNDRDSSALVVVDAVTVTLPKADRKHSIFYSDDAGNLLRDDPAQLTFDGPLRDVSSPAVDPTTLKKANS